MKSDKEILNLLYTGRIRDEELWQSLVGEKVVHSENGEGNILAIEGKVITVKHYMAEEPKHYHRKVLRNGKIRISDDVSEKTQVLIVRSRKKLQRTGVRS